MAKPPRSSTSGKKQRHTAAQKKAARQAREQQARAQLKGRRERPNRGEERGSGHSERPDSRQGNRSYSDRGDGYQSRDDRGGERHRGGYQGRDDRGGYQGRDDRGGYQGRDDRGGYGKREGGYQRRDDRGGSGSREGGYQRRENRDDFRGGERSYGNRGGGYQGRDDRGGYGKRDGGYQRRDDRGGSAGREGGYQRREDGQRRRWADENRDDWNEQRRDRDARESRGPGRPERTWRAHRDERDGHNPQRGRHEGRSWDQHNRSRDRFDRDDRQQRGGEHTAPFVEAEAERDEADAAYRDRRTQSVAATGPVEVTGDNGFAQLGVHDKLVATLARIGITEPFPIQSATIPDALAGKDLLGRGRTGSGKTMAFGLPMLHRLTELPRAVPHRPRALILSPTRELAMQIVDALAPLMRAVDKRFLLVAGGMSYTPQLNSLERGVDVLVATPGRLIDLVERRAADLSEVAITILDEADHMAEMGFVEAITQLLDLTPADGQRMLFSATLDHGVDRVAQTYLTDPVTHSTDDAQASVTTMDHHVFLVHPHHKKPVTAAIANRPGRTVVFCRTKLGADRIAMQLRESGVFAAALHGGLNQAQRTRVMDAFKSGELPVLVATDVAARGIHVDDVSLVLQVDPPADHKDYLHRSGRTARAGEDGVVVTLALPHQKRQVARLLDAAGVETDPKTVGPEDTAVIETAGGRTPEGEPIPQSRLDDILRPKRQPSRGPRGGRGGYGDRRGPRGGQGGRGQGGYDRGGRGSRPGQRQGGQGYNRGRKDPDAPRGDGRPNWEPR